MAVFYRPPADIDDYSRRPALAETLRDNWDTFIGDTIRGAERGLFYDAANDPVPNVVPVRQPIPWNGFPRSLWQWFNADADPAGRAAALAAVEVRREIFRVPLANGATLPIFERQQDEYCEWHVDRNAGGGITRIAFTSEGPEYFQEMAAVDLTLVGDLYREHVNPAVRDEELVWPVDVRNQNGQIVFPKGSYNRWNEWNTRKGIMHLTHRANTLGAEINLAADSTVQFPVPPAPAATLPFRLICCAQFGGVNRSSDPLIGAGVNGLAQSGLSITLDNPVGLYIQSVGIGGLRAPNGAPLGDGALRIVRASPDRSLILRAEVAPPAGATFTLDQCTFEGEPLTGGGQIARRITMVLFGLAKTIPGRTARQDQCTTKCCRKPNTAGFLKLVDNATTCAALTAADFEDEAPVTAESPLEAAVSTSPRAAVPLEQVLAASRATSRPR
jgi:hypothetical protein